MSNLYNKLFRISYKLYGRSEVSLYDQFINSNKKSYDELVNQQNIQLQKLINYASHNIPYYQKLFNSMGIDYRSITTIEDLVKLPVLTKKIIRENYEDFIPVKPYGKYINSTTGGSTGEPLRYKMSEFCYSRGFALLYRGWHYGGYNLGDKISVFAGGSLVGRTIPFRKKMVLKTRNMHSLSSYGVDEEILNQYVNLIQNWKPKFLRGYASALYLLAQFIIDKGGIEKLRITPPKAIFSTSEMLFDNQRALLENAFQSKVYNQYGLNDGGVSAYEDGIHDGFLIDTERSIMECVDDNGRGILGGEGRLLATSLFNYDFPFIRYDTGDLGIVSDTLLKKGGNRMVLEKLLGRITDGLDINGKKIGSPVLTILMGKVDALKYQIVHRKDNTLEIRVNRGPNYTEANENFIKESLVSHLGDIKMRFVYGDEFIDSMNKHKVIVKE